MKKMNLFNFGLGTRIYLSMIALVVISLLVTGIFTVYYFKAENDRYHLNRLQRQENSIILTLRYFTIENDINELSPGLENKIHRVAEINNLDINVYNLSGELLGTTQFELFEEQGLSTVLSDSLLDEILIQEHLILREDLYEEPFLSTYFILSDKSGAPLAIINLPYKKDGERVRRELNTFLITLGELYIALFAGASLLAILLSNYITGSLKKISRKLKEVRFNQKNEPIEWSANDEIGELVKDYNRMLEALEESAAMLAESERESAWKEMARQVAHEIKNPLTPMRLSIQHMERVAKAKPDDLEEKLKTFSKNLLRQIDTLSKIAGAFSDFAKMPAANPVKTDIHDLISSTVSMHSGSEEVKFLPDKKYPDVYVLADEEQLVRTFNNLITNALQAIPEGRDPEVVIATKIRGSQIKIEIRDNGEGIPEELEDKIFQPNFTTKSGGMGLGLAMVKNMVASNAGTISFTTERGKGTCFEINLPVIEA